MRRALDVVHVAGLGVWLGAVVMAGFAAARIFPLMHQLDPRLPGYASYEGDHWMLAAGKIANSVFVGADWVQMVCAALVVGTLVLGTMGKPASAKLLARWACVVLVVGLLGFNLMVLRPRMAVNSEAYWSAALRGQTDEAKKYQVAFSADHPTATRVMGGTAVALLLCMGASAWWVMERKDG